MQRLLNVLFCVGRLAQIWEKVFKDAGKTVGQESLAAVSEPTSLTADIQPVFCAKLSISLSA
jgi:hypothetical protein